MENVGSCEQPTVRYIGASWAECIGALRFLSGQTQAEAAAAVGLTQSDFSKIENGNRSVSVRYQQLFAEAVGLTDEEVDRLSLPRTQTKKPVHTSVETTPTQVDRNAIVAAAVVRFTRGPALSPDDLALFNILLAEAQPKSAE